MAANGQFAMPFAMINGADQWRRAAHEQTALDVDDGVVQLAWRMDGLDELSSSASDGETVAVTPAGLAFDPWCRLYRTIPEAGRLERLLWADASAQVQPYDLVPPQNMQAGDFIKQGPSTSLHRPQSVAVDRLGRLYLAESDKRRVVIYDLIDRRLLRRVQFSQRPTDLACDGERVYVLFDEGDTFARLEGYGAVRFSPLPESINRAARIAVALQRTGAPGLYVLDEAGSEAARIVPLADPDEWIAVPGASDLLFTDAEVMVVARGPNEDFRRFRVQSGVQWELPHMKARHYDGRGIVLTPDGRVGFWTEKGIGYATQARLSYVPRGRVTGFRLDSGQFQSVWGRLFIDACIPRGTEVKVYCLVMDEAPEEAKALARTAPDNMLTMTVYRPDLSPPMPPEALVKDVKPAQSLYRRVGGREFPWACAESEEGHATDYATYEAPVIGDVGRYLWVVIELHGTTSKTPKIRSLRAEYPGHDLLKRLPQIYSRDDSIAAFLQRYLGMMDGTLSELDRRAMCRHILLDPQAAPAQLLPWLADFIGLEVDRRWSEQARRDLIENAIWLFRYRGTVRGLERFIEIYLGRAVVIVEHFKVRGLGGALVGESEALASSAVVGAGFRIGGQVGEAGRVSVSGDTLRSAVSKQAHRFSVIIPLELDREQRDVVEHILEVHRPAHTLYDICSVDAGMRAGIALYAGLTSIVGRTSGFGQIQVGGSLVGRGHLLGRPGAGGRVGGSHLGYDSRVV